MRIKIDFLVYIKLRKNEIREGDVKMQTIAAKRVLIFVIAVFCVSLIVGCSGMEKRPKDRSGYLYYPVALVSADRALDEARNTGKDKECPAGFNALKERVDRAYEVYMAAVRRKRLIWHRKRLTKLRPFAL